MTTPELTIGEVAGACGVPVSTVRYYCDIGLLVPRRRAGGKRRFDRAAIDRVKVIRQCQQSAFSLDEISGILDDENEWRAIVDTKLAELRERRHDLDQAIELLTEIRTCGCDAVGRCPTLARR